MAYQDDDFNGILADINAKIDALTSDSNEKSVLIQSMKNAFDNKSRVEIERLEEFSNDLNNLRDLLEQSRNSEDYQNLVAELKSAEQAFRNEIMNVSFDKKNMLAELKDDIVKVFEKTTYLEELYPNKSIEYLSEVKELISSNISAVQAAISNQVKNNFNTMVEGVGALYGSVQTFKDEILTNNTSEARKLADNLQIISGNASGLVIKVDELTSILSKEASDSKEMLQILRNADAKANELELSFKSELSHRMNELDNGIASVNERIESVKSEMKQAADNNFMQLYEGIKTSAELIKDFKNNTGENLTVYFTAIKEAMVAFSDEMKSIQENTGSEIFDRYMAELDKLASEISRLDSQSQSREQGYKDYLDSKLSEINGFLDSLQKSINISDFNSGNVLGEHIKSLEELILKTSEAKDEKLDTLEKFLNDYLVVINNHFEMFGKDLKNLDSKISLKVDGMSDTLSSVSGKADEQSSDIREIKSLINSVFDEIQKNRETVKYDLTLNGEKASFIEERLLEYLKNLYEEISKNTEKHSFETDEKISEIRNLISDIRVNIEDCENENIIKFSDKLSGLESVLSESYNAYEKSLAGLDEKLEKYIISMQEVSGEANSKLEDSLEGLRGIQNDLNETCERIKASDIEKSELISRNFNDVIVKFNEVLTGVESCKDGFDNNVRKIMQDNVEFIDKGLGFISENLAEIKSKQTDSIAVISEEIVGKISQIQNDFGALTTEIIQTVNEKGESLIEEFDAVKTSVEQLVSLNFEGIVEDIKNQIQDSYLNMTDKLSERFDGNKEIFLKVEDTYKDVISRCISLEAGLSAFADKDFDLVSSAVVSIDKNIKANIEKADSMFEEWKTAFSQLDEKFNNMDTKVEFTMESNFDGLEKRIDEKLLLNKKEFCEYISKLFEDKNFVQLIEHSNKELSEKLEVLNLQITESLESGEGDKNTIFAIKQVLQDAVEVLSNKSDIIDSKIDVIAQIDNTEIIDEISVSTKNILDSVSDLNTKLNEFSRRDDKNEFDGIGQICSNIEKTVSELGAKIDVIAMDDCSNAFEDTNEFIQDVKNAVDEVNSKLDVLAMEDNSEEFEEISASISDLRNDLSELNKKVENFIGTTGNLNNSDSSQNLSANVENYLKELNAKLDVLAAFDNSELEEEVAASSERLINSLNELHAKVDVLAMDEDSSMSDDFSECSDRILEAVSELKVLINNKSDKPSIDLDVDKLMERLKELHSKVDIIAQEDYSGLQYDIDEIKHILTGQQKILENNDNSEVFEKLDGIVQNLDSSDDKFSKNFELLHNKLDVLADDSEIQNNIDEIKHILTEQQKFIESNENNDVNEKLDEIVQNIDDSGDKITRTLELLHNKVDILAMADDENIKEEIQDIKDLILLQQQSFEKDAKDEKSQEISSHLQKLISDINKIEKNVSEIDLEKNSRDIKDSVMTVMLSAMEQVSFVEETEEIKDFVEEKTDAINRTLLDVKKQLSSIASSGDDMDFYSYTLQDVEADLAKLRLSLSELSSSSSSNESAVISANLGRIAKSVENLQNSIGANSDVTALKYEFSKLSEDILSLSSRTNKILLNYDESQKAIRSGLDEFSLRTERMQEKLNDFTRLSVIEKKVEESVNTAKVLQNVMIYLGEWMDGTSEIISSIYDKSAKAASTHDILEQIKLSAPEQADMLKVVECRFEEQQSRIDRLEQKLEKALEMLSDYDENVITAKIDRIDKSLGKLTQNIEKLTAYVDED